jgi:hypothetical protein
LARGFQDKVDDEIFDLILKGMRMQNQEELDEQRKACFRVR